MKACEWHYVEQLQMLYLKWFWISRAFVPFGSHFSPIVSLPAPPPPTQVSPLLHQPACVTSTTACAGGRTTPTPLSSGPCTVTVSLLVSRVKILHDSLPLSAKQNESELLHRAGVLCVASV